MDEFERIAAINARLTQDGYQQIQVGIGDDCAVLAGSTRAMAVSVDCATEGVHFERRWCPLAAVGYRATVAAVSDLAAMGAAPYAAVANLQMPPTLEDDELMQIVDGQAAASAEYRLPLVGGNLSRSEVLSLTTTVLGRLPGAPLLRSGASPGDLVCCSGTLGDAALGLEILRGGDQQNPTLLPFVSSFLRPCANVTLGESLVGRATACIDVSDGLGQDLHHLCRASNVGAVVDLGKVPHGPGFARIAAAFGLSASTLTVSGGEDYALLFTVPPTMTLPANCTAIGRCTERGGVRFELDNLPVEPGAASGYLHF